MITATPTSALVYDTAVWYLVSVCGRVGVWQHERCDGLNQHELIFSTEFSIGRSSRKSRETQTRRGESKNLCRLCKKARFGLQSKTAVFN